MPVKIRRAKSGDLSDVLSLFEQSVRLTCSGEYSQKQIEAWVGSRNNLERWLNKIKNDYFILAFQDENLAGFASLSGSDYVDLMYVNPVFQGQGIATHLLEVIEKRGRDQGAEKFCSDVSDTARGFFLKQGYSILHKNIIYVDGVEISNSRMEKCVK